MIHSFLKCKSILTNIYHYYFRSLFECRFSSTALSSSLMLPLASQSLFGVTIGTTPLSIHTSMYNMPICHVEHGMHCFANCANRNESSTNGTSLPYRQKTGSGWIWIGTLRNEMLFSHTSIVSASHHIIAETILSRVLTLLHIHRWRYISHHNIFIVFIDIPPYYYYSTTLFSSSASHHLVSYEYYVSIYATLYW